MNASAQTAVVPPVGEAPKQGMIAGSWSSGIKEYVATAFEAYDANNAYSASSPTAPISKVWITGAQGVPTEIYWPSVDRAQVRDSQFLVSDGKGFFFEERRDAVHEVKWIRPGIPAFITTSRDPQNRFSIQRTIHTDPNSSVVIEQIRIVRNVPGLSFYYLHNPAVGNTAMGDSGRVNNTDEPGLYAWQDNEAQAVVFTIGLPQVSAGLEGANDGYQDLLSDFNMDSRFETATNGNVALTAKLDVPATPGVTEFNVAIGFGATWQLAREQAANALKDVNGSLQTYIHQWEEYQAGLKDLSAASLDGGNLFRSSMALLKSVEDKTSEGAFIASPSVPWGLHQYDGNVIFTGHSVDGAIQPANWDSRSQQVGGYHLVWPRDLYQIATTFLAVGDTKSAVASLQFLRRIQFGPNEGSWHYGPRVIAKDGAFLQNCWVDGTPYWTGLQMDQTSYPLLLAYRLWKSGLVKVEDYSDMIVRAGNFVQRYGPWTAQERWEENFGVSPSTAAGEIAALWVAADMADALGKTEEATRFRASADSWSAKPGDNLEAWTFTETGGLGNGKYYQRIEGASFYDQKWDPNDNSMFMIQNGGGWKREKDVIDGGFLELVRIGLRSPRDYHVLETIHEYDHNIRGETSRGVSFFRYVGDRYNYDDTSGVQTRGMLWPILTGERAHYELALAVDKGASASEIDGAVVPYIGAIENFATPSFMIPEQVWDKGNFQGMPTGAATPLSWSHAEYVKLLASRLNKQVFDRIPLVSERAGMLSRNPSPSSR